MKNDGGSERTVGEGGRYVVGRLLGTGAFGRVYEGTDRKLDGRRVAIKHLLPQARQHREVWTRFLQEARILATLNHPHIIKIFDIDEANDCIVLEVAAGGTLEGLIEQRGRVPIHTEFEFILEFLDALDTVHDKCIWHRDLKPANVLLDGSNRVKITDFGIAHASIASGVRIAETRANAVMGTPIYMAPEQLRGEPIDGRCDIWAVGAMLYQMLTGVLHLPVWTLEDVHPALMREMLLEMITTKRPKPVSELNPILPSYVDAVVQRAIEPLADRRYASAEEMRKAVKRLLRRLPDPSDTTLPTPSSAHSGGATVAAAPLPDPTPPLVDVLPLRNSAASGAASARSSAGRATPPSDATARERGQEAAAEVELLQAARQLERSRERGRAAGERLRRGGRGAGAPRHPRGRAHLPNAISPLRSARGSRDPCIAPSGGSVPPARYVSRANGSLSASGRSLPAGRGALPERRADHRRAGGRTSQRGQRERSARVLAARVDA